MTISAAAASGPLQGSLVLDFGQAAVGPVAAEYLGMLGATVIKIEPPKGDAVRFGKPSMKGTSTSFVGNNLTKFGITLDLKLEADLHRAKQLIRFADVLIENFRSKEVMVRLGLGPDILKSLNPKLIYLSSSAFGEGGPLESMRSNEWVTEALSGYTSVTGREKGPGEFLRGAATLDWTGAMINTVAVLAALVRRSGGNAGSHLLTSQLGSSIYGGLTRFAEVLAGWPSGGPLGSASMEMVPDEAFRTSDGWVAVSAPTQASWIRLCRVLGIPAWIDDPRFSTNSARIENRDELVPELSKIFLGRTTQAWAALLQESHVPSAAVPGTLNFAEYLQSHPQMAAADMLLRVPSPYGEVLTQAPHWTFSKTPAAIASGPPLLGAHTKIVLGNLQSKRALVEALESSRAVESARGAEAGDR